MQTQVPKEDPIAKSLDLEPLVDEPKPVQAVVEVDDTAGQSERDLKYSRENLYHLIERGRAVSYTHLTLPTILLV